MGSATHTDSFIKVNKYGIIAAILSLLILFGFGSAMLGSLPNVEAAKPPPKPTSTGRIAYLATGVGSNFDIYIMNADGSTKVNLTNSAQNELAPAISPDGRKIVFARTTSTTPYWDSDIYTMNVDGSNLTRLTFGATDQAGSITSNMPDWSPDGNKIVYRAQGIWTMNANGTNPTQIHPTGSAPNWSPDGSKIVFMNYDSADTTHDLYTMNSDGSNVVNITNSIGTTPSSDEGYPAWSSDGTKIAFVADAPEFPNADEVFVINATGGGHQRLTYTIDYSEYHPDWSPDGSKITFTSRRTGFAEIYAMNADGSNQTNISNYGSSAAQMNPQNSSWGIVPSTTVNRPPVADFNYSSRNNTVRFTNRSTDPDNDILTYLWNFGDGTTSTEKSPSHTYSSEFLSDTNSRAIVTLTAIDPSGASSSIVKDIAVR